MDLRAAWRALIGKAEPGAYPPNILATAEAHRWDTGNPVTEKAQAKLYNKLSWINAGVGAIARNVALQDFHVMHRVAGEQTQEIDNHPFEILLEAPNPLMSQYEFFFALVAWIKLTGNAYVQKNMVGGRLIELWVIPPYRIKPIPDGRSYIKGYEYDPGNGEAMFLECEEITHFKNWHPTNDWVGASDIQALAMAAETDWNMASSNAHYFDKDNIKMPGILMFKDPIADTPWRKMAADFKKALGGNQNQQLHMMRAMGDKGVEFVANAISNKDMDFVAGREFGRDEIFSVIAPGYASQLAVNATEASSKVGLTTMMDQGVWPQCVAIAQKLTGDVLPLYGDGLLGQFDDPRIVDRIIENEERRLYQIVHTVEETRNRFDGDEPLGDDRDLLLVPQVDKLAASAVDGVQGATPPGLSPFGAPPADEPEMRVELDGDDPDKPDPDDEDLEGLRNAELAKWRRKVVKRGAGVSFNPDYLPTDLVAVVKARLALADSRDEVRAAFSGPFLVKAERTTLGGLTDPFAADKDASERRIDRIMRRRLKEQYAYIIRKLGAKPDMSKLPADYWAKQDAEMQRELRPEIEKLARMVTEAMIVSG